MKELNILLDALKWYADSNNYLTDSIDDSILASVYNGGAIADKATEAIKKWEDSSNEKLIKMYMTVPENGKPILNEVFADNGVHSHWELIDTANGKILWTEDSSGKETGNHEHEINYWIKRALAAEEMNGKDLIKQVLSQSVPPYKEEEKDGQIKKLQEEVNEYSRNLKNCNDHYSKIFHEQNKEIERLKKLAYKEEVDKDGVAQEALKNVWAEAIILANNICVAESNRFNGDDEIENADVADKCAKEIRKYLSVENSMTYKALTTTDGEQNFLESKEDAGMKENKNE